MIHYRSSKIDYGSEWVHKKNTDLSRIRSIKLWIKIHNYGVFMAFYGVFNLYWGFYFVLQIPWKVTFFSDFLFDF